MKYVTSLLFGLIFIVGLSFAFTPFLNDIYISFYNLEAGPDSETELFKFLLYVQWPLFFAAGFFVGYLIHRKVINNN